MITSLNRSTTFIAFFLFFFILKSLCYLSSLNAFQFLPSRSGFWKRVWSGELQAEGLLGSTFRRYTHNRVRKHWALKSQVFHRKPWNWDNPSELSQIEAKGLGLCNLIPASHWTLSKAVRCGRQRLVRFSAEVHWHMFPATAGLWLALKMGSAGCQTETSCS